MLNTDQHNAQVKNRMTVAAFIKNNRGIADGRNLPDATLEAIFNDIASNEIILNDEQAQKMALKSLNDPETNARFKNNKDLAQLTIASEAMVLNTEAKFNNILKNKGIRNSNTTEKGESVFYQSDDCEHVKAMLQIVWTAILSSLSGPLQETEDLEYIYTALEGFKYAIHIMCLFDMDLERNAFVSTLAKASLPSHIQEVRSKNLEAIRYLLDIANTEGDSFAECWKDVMSCISQLERLQLLGSEGEQEIQRIRRFYDTQVYG